MQLAGLGLALWGWRSGARALQPVVPAGIKIFVDFNFIRTAYVLEIGIVITAVWHLIFAGGFHKISLDITSLIVGDFAAGAVLITFGAVLGKCSSSQLWRLASLEVVSGQ